MYQNRLKGYKKLGYQSRLGTGDASEIIFDATNFETALYNDINGATQSIVIASPYLHEKSVTNFINMIANLQNIGIAIYTKDNEKNPNRVRQIIQLLEDASIKVHVLPKLHQQFVIIDNNVLWYGELNPLCFAGEDDIVMRIPSREIAKELLSRLY